MDFFHIIWGGKCFDYFDRCRLKFSRKGVANFK